MENKNSDKKLARTVELLNAFMGNKFENYLELNDFIENHLISVQKDIDKKFDELHEIDDSDFWKKELRKFEDEIGYEGFKFDHEFPNRVRFSAIVQTFSMLEVYLKWLCEKLQAINKFPIGISDLKGNSDLEKSKLYLKKLYDIDFAKLEPEWSFINDMKKLRNRIIHYNGEFTLEEKEIVKLIERVEHLGRMWDDIEPEMKPDSEYEIKICSKKLNEIFVNKVRIFFNKLTTEISTQNFHTA